MKIILNHKYNILEMLLIIFCFFPFVGIDLGTDTQPFALIISAIIIICKKNIIIKNKKIVIFFLGILTILSTISLFYINEIQILKRLFSYVSLLIIPIATYNCNYLSNEEELEKIIKLIIMIWFFVGIIQLLFAKSFLTFLVPLSRTSSTRGVCSLASEPSFYGYMCFLMMMFSIYFKKNKLLYIALLIIQIVFFAQSAVSLIYLVIFYVVYFLVLIFNKKIKYYRLIKIFLLILCALFVFYIIDVYMPNTRISQIYNSLINDPFGLIETDKSVSRRIDSLIMSFSNCGLPTLIGNITLMSGFGGMIYEMGIFAIPIIFNILKTIYDANTKEYRITCSLSIFFSMFSAIQLSSPLFAFYLGYCNLKKGGKIDE